MNKISCNIIRDLLPLYIDNVCSEESKTLIEEHISQCPLCEAELLNFQNNTDIKSDIDKDIDKAVKNANKKIKKGKKKVAIKTLCIVLCVAMLSGIFILFQYPLFFEKSTFFTSGFKALSEYETWEIESSKKANYENDLAKCYIDSKHGKFEETKISDGFSLRWSEKKFIAFIDTRTGENFNSDTTFDEFCKELNESRDSWYYPIFILKNGVKELGYETEFSPLYDLKLVRELITTEPPETAIFLNFDEYSKACTYYHLHLALPVADKFIVGESKNNVMWGTINNIEDFDAYMLYYQPYENVQKETMVIFRGFSKEETQEIAKSIVIK